MKEKIIELMFVVCLLIILVITFLIVIEFTQETKPKLEKEDIYYLNL